MATTKNIQIRGVPLEGESKNYYFEPELKAHEKDLKEFEKELGLEQDSGYQISVDRADATTNTVKDVDDDDVIVLHMDDGSVILTTERDLATDFPNANRSTVDGKIIGSSLDLGLKSRGIGDWFIKGVEFFKGPITKKSAKFICEKYEDKTITKPGVVQIDLTTPGTEPKLTYVDTIKTDDASGHRILLFLHGTASHTLGSFGELFKNQQLVDDLNQTFGQHIYGLQHRTLTQSPIDNVIELLDVLPDNAELYLVSHSRGGLVGELLCRAMRINEDPFTDDEIKAFDAIKEDTLSEIDDEDIKKEAKANYEDQQKRLKKLNGLFKRKNLAIKRFVRVACPARGTTLASGRLDRWLSGLLTVIGYIPALKASKFYGLFKSFALALVNTRTNPQVIPGLEAQMPTSPLVRLLNDHKVQLSADLSVIAGDIEKDGFFSKIGIYVTDKFFDGDHDLVVNTASMYGGGNRIVPTRYHFDQGTDVSHFNYFKNFKTASRVITGLIGKEDELANAFDPVPPPHSPVIARSLSRSVAPRKTVFVIHGILGSSIAQNNNTIWVDLLELNHGGLKKIAVDKPNVKSVGILASHYQDLMDELSTDSNVIPFFYDWRLSVFDAAKDLATQIQTVLDQQVDDKYPVSIVAHSMGGLVTRAMIANHNEVWQAMMAHPQSRYIMLGTPNGGSHSIASLLTGKLKMIRLLALADFKSSKSEILEIVSKFPGVLNMLPSSGGTIDLFNYDNWVKLARETTDKFTIPAKKDLNKALTERRSLNQIEYHQYPDGKVLYLAGHAKETPTDVRVSEGGDIVIRASNQGDGQVLWKTGIPYGVKTWYADVLHGDLPRNDECIQAVRDLLDDGTTNRLSTQPPQQMTARGPGQITTEEEFDMTTEPIEFVPNGRDLLESVMYSEPEYRQKTISSKRIEIEVTHGDCVFAKYPIAVGHYLGDSIYSAEKAVDRRYDKSLTKRLRLGLYPGKDETCEVIIDLKRKPKGIIVLGLGMVGELTVQKLTQAYAIAMKEYALQQHEYLRNFCENPNDAKQISVSTVLIGGSNGGLPVMDCLQAMLDGVHQANTTLASVDDEPIQITKIQLIELWEDIAIISINKLAQLLNFNYQLGQHYQLRSELVDGIGGRFRSHYGEDEGWLQRTQIRETPDGDLTFNLVTNRARIEYRIMPVDKQKVTHFISQATKDTAQRSNISKTLFEMMLPNELKNSVAMMNDTVLMLDEATAAYPWELMEDRWGRSKMPPAASFKMIRQLESQYFSAIPNVGRSNKALVIGAPKLSDRRLYLPGAVAEAKFVEQFYRQEGGYQVTSEIESDGFSILNAIHEHRFKIMHFTGHGVYEHPVISDEVNCKTCGCSLTPEHKHTGMMIGDDMFLTAENVSNIRFVPELVFLNCCYLGKTENVIANPNYPAIAANLATQFIRQGCKAVIAAGWAVEDRAAVTFAQTFYQAMIEGQQFGTAVLAARKNTWLSHPGVNTWGAYQCYGDYEYTLERAKSRSNNNDEPWLAKAELVTVLKSLAADAKTLDTPDKYTETYYRKKLNTYIKQAEQQHPKWFRSADVCSAFAEGFKEIANFDQAVKWYKRALQAENGLVSIHATEQLANVMVRRAGKITLDQYKPDTDEDNSDSNKNETQRDKEARRKAEILSAGADIDQAIEYLHQLITLFGTDDETAVSATRERLALLGSAYKRKAVWEKYNPKRNAQTIRKRVFTALESMYNYYDIAAWATDDAILTFSNKGSQAIELAAKSRLTDSPVNYAYLNAVSAQYLLSLFKDPKDRKNPYKFSSDQIKILETIEAQSRKNDELSPSFWNLVGVADAQIINALVKEDFDSQADDIVNNYQTAIKRGASSVQVDSVKDNLILLQELFDPDVATGRKNTRECKRIHNHLTTILKSMDA